ncbi:hypothetical protein ES703_83775 [subsurface metagenome]
MLILNCKSEMFEGRTGWHLGIFYQELQSMLDPGETWNGANRTEPVAAIDRSPDFVSAERADDRLKEVI